MNQSKKQEIRACTFEMQVTEGSGNIKFPCFCYVEWKTSNGKDIVKSPNRVKLIQKRLAFNERLTLTTPLIYDLSLQAYLKKQSVIILNLLSNSRPNEPKLVGRVTIELSSVANGTHFGQLAQYPLQFCSVEATLTFRVVLQDYAQTNLALRDLDRSQYSQLQAVGERQVVKEDTKSESGAKSISSVNISQGVASRMKNGQHLQRSTDLCFQDRINPIKSENEQLYNVRLPEGSSQLKRQTESNSNLQMNHRQQRQQQYVYQPRPLSNDLSVPVLTKNADEFDSNKISERTISHPDKSEKQILLRDSKIREQLKESNESLQEQLHTTKNGKASQREMEHKQEQSQSNKQIDNLKKQNDNLFIQLQSKNRNILALITENNQMKDKVMKLNEKIAHQSQRLEEIQELNYPALTQQLNRTIHEKDREIESLITSTFQAEKNLQDKQAQLQGQIAQLKEHIRQLEEQKAFKATLLANKQASPIKSQTSSRGKQEKASSTQSQELNQRVDDLTYKLEIERKNNENSKLELAEIQQWYKEMQEQAERLSIEKEELRQLFQGQKQKSSQLQLQIDQLTESNQQFGTSNALQSQSQQAIGSLTNQLNEVTQELNASKVAIKQLQYNSSKLEQQLQSTRKELDQIQSKFVEQEQQLANSMQTITLLNHQVDKYKAQALSNLSTSKRKGQQLEDAERKLTDLIKRMKEKEQNGLRCQRQAEQTESKLKMAQANVEKLKQRTKALEGDKNVDQQKIKSLEKQIRLLRNKSDRDQESLSKQMNKLRQSLENEINKRKQVANMLSEVQSKSKQSQNSTIKELQRKINKYVEKQYLFKQQLSILDEQSNKISQILQEKQENQDTLVQSLNMLAQQNATLRAKINELDSQCELLGERNQGLEAEIELLNAYQPNQPDGNEIGELNKKLIDKNKELLHQIEEKNSLIAEYEKTEGQMRGKQAEQLLSSSRHQRQVQQYQQKYQQMVDQNERLYREFQNVNNKYKQQLSEASQASLIKIQSLQSKIEQLYGKLTQKDVKYGELEMKSKEDVQKLQQNLHEKQYQVQYYSNEVKDLTSNLETLNEQIGQKQFQLHLAEQKIKQLFENINNLSLIKPAPVLTPQPIQLNQELQQELRQYKSRVQLYEAQIERLNEKEFMQEKELITINEELARFKQNGEQEARHIAYLEEQLKNCRERQSKYIQQVDKLTANENLFKSRYTRLEKDKTQMISEIEKLREQMESLKQKISDKSRESTPINKFKGSPSPLKPITDISEIVGEINNILAKRKQQEDLESALRLVIDNNTRQEEQFEQWSRERGLIQQKAKLVSKQLQKIKSNIMKTANKSIAQKSQLTNLLRPAEAVINQLINISEHLNELDPYEEQEEQFEGQDRAH